MVKGYTLKILKIYRVNDDLSINTQNYSFDQLDEMIGKNKNIHGDTNSKTGEK